MTKATESKDKTKLAEEEEKVNLSATGALTKGNGEEIGQTNLEEELGKYFVTGKYNVEPETNAGVEGYIVTITENVEDGNNYFIAKNGNISKITKTTEVWYKVDGTTLHLSNSKLDDNYKENYNGNFEEANKITVVVIDNEIVPRNTSNWFNSIYNVVEFKNLYNLNTVNVTDMSWMFYCPELTSLDLSTFNTSNVVNMEGMFQACEKLEYLNVSSFDTSSVTNFSWMFNYCENLEKIEISNFDTSNATNMSLMFGQCLKLKQLDISNFDTSKVTDMNSMFQDCEALENLELDSLDVSSVTDMDWMFNDCRKLKTLDLSSFETNSLVTTVGMFFDCAELQEVKLEKMNTTNVTCMNAMFLNCSSLKSLDLKSFDTRLVNVDISKNGYELTDTFKGVTCPIYVDSSKWNLTEMQTGYTGKFES